MQLRTRACLDSFHCFDAMRIGGQASFGPSAALS